MVFRHNFRIEPEGDLLFPGVKAKQQPEEEDDYGFYDFDNEDVSDDMSRSLTPPSGTGGASFDEDMDNVELLSSLLQSPSFQRGTSSTSVLNHPSNAALIWQNGDHYPEDERQWKVVHIDAGNQGRLCGRCSRNIVIAAQQTHPRLIIRGFEGSEFSDESSTPSDESYESFSLSRKSERVALALTSLRIVNRPPFHIKYAEFELRIATPTRTYTRWLCFADLKRLLEVAGALQSPPSENMKNVNLAWQCFLHYRQWRHFPWLGNVEVQHLITQHALVSRLLEELLFALDTPQPLFAFVENYHQWCMDPYCATSFLGSIRSSPPQSSFRDHRKPLGQTIPQVPSRLEFDAAESLAVPRDSEARGVS